MAGVVLQDGRELDAAMVVSSADARRSLLELVEPGWLDPDLIRALRHVRRRGVAARLRIQLDRSPGFVALALAPSLDYLERAYDDAKHGRVSRQPYVEARCDAQHRVEVHVQYAPYGADCSKLGDTVLAMLSEHWGDAAPHEGELLSPQDLEQSEGWPEGQPHHAELSLDQALWMRPLPELARYRTPIHGLWLCGAGHASRRRHRRRRGIQLCAGNPSPLNGCCLRCWSSPARRPRRPPTGCRATARDTATFTVSGVSAGGYMAVQMHIAHSSRITGVGALAAGPYYCAQGSISTAVNNCMTPGAWSPLPSAAVVKGHVERFAMEKRIDPPGYLARGRAWLFSGTQDSTVKPEVVDALARLVRCLQYQARGGQGQAGRSCHGYPRRRQCLRRKRAAVHQ